MRVAHLCLSNWYIEGLSYQENELIRQHVDDGHEVSVLASTETHGAPGELAYTETRTFIGPEGAKVTRLPYRGWPARLARKLRIHPGVYEELEKFGPDVILFHGTCGWEVMTAARYARDNPHVLYYIDSHEDWNNSARNFLSREILHKLYYRFCLGRAWPDARRILCISTETMDFVEEVYRVPRERLEFFPLGGRPVHRDEYAERRARMRRILEVGEGDILIVQSGKQTRRKKLIESLRAFSSHGPKKSRLVIAGSLDEEIREVAEQMIARDPRVEYLGWRNVDQLTDILCAADVYLQPGTQSVTMQHSMCCHCAVIIADVPSHKIYMDENGWLVNSDLSIEAALAETQYADLMAMQERSYAFSKRMLDYAQLAKRVLRA